MQRARVPGERLTRGPVTDPDERGPARRARVGVLALQGDVLEHLRMLERAGAEAVPVKRAEELDALDGVLIPGGESTTIGKLADMYGLLEPLRKRIANGLPAFGTCAGAILLAREALHADGRPAEQPLLACMDAVVRRNAFGRQVHSFEADLDVRGLDAPLHAVFIRAPWFERIGPDVEALAVVATEAGAKVVVARQGHLLASAFHPELTDDERLHRLFVAMVDAQRDAAAAGNDSGGDSGVRSQQVVDDQAQEGRGGRQAREAVRAADPGDRGGSEGRGREPRREPDARRRDPEGP